MAFHTNTDVISKFKKLSVDVNTTVTITELTAIVTNTDAYVYGRINPFYVVSDINATDTPISYKIINEICALYSAGKVNEILRKNGVEITDQDELNKTGNLIERAEYMLAGIQLYATEGNVQGSIDLSDAESRELSTKNAATGQGTSVPQIKKDTVQW